MGLGTHWTHCELDLSYNAIDHLISISSHSDELPLCVLGLLELIQFRVIV